MIFDRIRKIVTADHDNKQSGKAADDKAMRSIVSTKDADRPYKLTGEDLGLRLASAGHVRGLHLPTRIDSVRLRLRPFAYDSTCSSELSSDPSELSGKSHPSMANSSTSLGPESS
jgi:hypothetical protein